MPFSSLGTLGLRGDLPGGTFCQPGAIKAVSTFPVTHHVLILDILLAHLCYCMNLNYCLTSALLTERTTPQSHINPWRFSRQVEIAEQVTSAVSSGSASACVHRDRGRARCEQGHGCGLLLPPRCGRVSWTRRWGRALSGTGSHPPAAGRPRLSHTHRPPRLRLRLLRR